MQIVLKWCTRWRLLPATPLPSTARTSVVVHQHSGPHLHPQGQPAARDVSSWNSSFHVIPLFSSPACLSSIPALWIHVLPEMPIISPVYTCFVFLECIANSRHYHHVAFMAARCTFIYCLLSWQVLVTSQCGNTVVKMVFTSSSPADDHDVGVLGSRTRLRLHCHSEAHKLCPKERTNSG